MKKYVKLPNGIYGYRGSGNGPLVVLLHGWPVDSHHWRRTVPQLSAHGFSCLPIDLKGLGASKSTGGSFEKRSIAKEMFQAIRKIRPDAHKFSIIGHDWGGSVALAMGILFPKWISNIVIEEEIPPGISVKIPASGAKRYPTWHGPFHRQVGLAETLIGKNYDSYIGYFLDLRMKRESLSSRDRIHYLETNRPFHKFANALAYYRTHGPDCTFFRSLKKRKLQIPVLTIGGKYAMGKAVFTAASQIASTVTFEHFRNSGHYPAEEQAAKFTKVVANFLRS